MERAKEIMQKKGGRRGIEEILKLPKDSIFEIAESFGDLLFKQGAMDYSIAVYHVADSSQKLMKVGDALLENLRKTKVSHANFVRANKSPPYSGSVAAFRASWSVVESTFYAIKILAAYSLAENLDAPRRERFKKLSEEYAACSDSVKEYVTACRRLKSGDLKALDVIIKIVI